jgi:DNA-binding beta-propeller fold protein YncE
LISKTGEYNYLVNDSKGNAEQVQREDDVVYVISNISNTMGYSADDTINTERITLYGEIEEGKEGDMSDIAVYTNDNIDTIYAGIRYYQGGREGIFIIPDISRIVSKLDGINNNLSNTIKFIPLGSTGPEQIFVNVQMNTIYALLEYDDFIAIIDGSTNEIKEKIIMQNPRAMSINPSAGLLYVASGDSFWFNIVDMTTHKVIGVNTQISYPVASAVNNLTGRVFVAECLECDDFDFTNGTSIYALDSNGSTINWNTYENINIEENGLAINPFTNKLYAIGTNTKSELSNLYIIDIQSR